jgi:two-component system phosphate regulon sensor histidine kinase PhoR
MHTGRWRTFWRLFGAYVVLVLTVIGLLGWVVVGRVEKQVLADIEQHLLAKNILVEEIIRAIPADQTDQLQARFSSLAKEVEIRITLINADGKVLVDSAEDPARMENHANRPEVIAAHAEGIGKATRHSSTVGESMIYVARRVEGKSPVAYVRVARPLDSIGREVAQLERIVWAFAGGSAAAVLVLAFWLARRITRPLRELTAGAERIAAGDYGHKVYAIRQDEIGTVARAFNTMSERLAEQFRQVEEDRHKLRTVLRGMVEGVIAIDAEQRVLFANERAGQLLDFQSESVVGRKLWEVVRQRSFQEVVQRGQEKAEPHHEELDWNGAFVKSLAVNVARLQGSPALGAVLVLQDTTELRRLERLRQDFVANVSHELKTPLSVIKASIETLLTGAMDDIENRVAFLEQIDEQASRLHMLIIDLLSLARIESGAEAFEFGPVAIEPVVRECVERHRSRAEAKRQVLQVAGGNGNGSASASNMISSTLTLPIVTAWVDEEAVSQILDNLIDNAVKYTPPEGHIAVGWHVEDSCVCLEVQDTGIGIPERDLPRIFERFYRVDKARSRELGGTGLGLSIVKHLVQAMNGTVTATSRVNQGTTFTIRLPRAAAT